ncbi:unnamed protein product, partial [Amoebophrya sp. A120]|eukprot:GSA120T00019586001.1
MRERWNKPHQLPISKVRAAEYEGNIFGGSVAKPTDQGNGKNVQPVVTAKAEEGKTRIVNFLGREV